MSKQTFALLNLVLIVAAGGIGIAAYLRRGPELSGIRGSRLLGPAVRGWYFSNLEPFAQWFVRVGVSPAALSWAQLVAAVATGWAYATGLIYTAGFLVLFTGTLDILDGRVARSTNGASRRGAFLDSVIDRYAEFAGYVGLLVYFESGWEVWAILLAIFGGSMVSYTRARAEGLGVRCEVGLLQRPERFVLLGLGSIFSSLAVHLRGARPTPDAHVLLAFVLLAMAVLSNLTALQRAWHAYRALGEERDS